MKRVVIVPVTDVERFPDLEIVARDGSLTALVGNSTAARTRAAFDSEDAFLNAVALGLADRHTFNSLAEATTFAVAKLDSLAETARRIEEAIQQRSAARPQPEKHTDSLSAATPWKEESLMSGWGTEGTVLGAFPFRYGTDIKVDDESGPICHLNHNLAGCIIERHLSEMPTIQTSGRFAGQ
jgi:hypothetical protein